MPEKIKHYEVLEQRVGEEAIIYKAWDPTFERHVTIKEPLPHLLKEGSFLDSFLEGGKQLANINNENVIRFIELIHQGEVDERCYLVEEYVGETLEGLLKRGPVDVSVGKTIFKDVLWGLRAIHKAGLIHLNIRPSGILITPEGRAKITDLRIAWVMESESTVILTSPKYHPHEVLIGDGEIGPWSDLYSLGYVAYEMFLGSSRFEAQFQAPAEGDPGRREIKDIQYREWHCNRSLRAKPLIEIDDKIPKFLSALTARLMEKAIDQRYQSADHALRDLGTERAVEEKPAELRLRAQQEEGGTRPIEAPHEESGEMTRPLFQPVSAPTEVPHEGAGEMTRPLFQPGLQSPAPAPKEEARGATAAPTGKKVKPGVAVAPAESTFWQDFLIVFGVAIIGLVIIALMIKLLL